MCGHTEHDGACSRGAQNKVGHMGKVGMGLGLVMGHMIGGRGMMWATWRATLERTRPQPRLGHISGRVRPCISGLFLPSSAFPPSLRSGET